jgi:8-oxo-dGTP pyrophosphatase MutT (NUDIX family)
MSKEFKTLLEHDYGYRSEALWKNEQSGETRVNLFIGFVTLAVGLMVSALSKDSELEGAPLLLLLLVGLIVLLAVGYVTLRRIITRNIRTDEAKVQLDAIRQTFKDHFDDEGALADYRLFPPKRGREPERRGKVDARRFGGLAHTVGVINALLCAGIAFVIILLLGMPFRRPDVVTYFSAGFAALLASGYVFYWQIQYADDEEERAKNTFRSDLGLPTHAGGVVYELRDGIPHYLMISPKDRNKSDRKEWVLPKGHIKDGETPGETAEEHGEAALREVREETGVVARLAGLLGRVKFNKQGEDQDAKFYLMEKIFQGIPKEKREVRWLPFEEAVAQLTYPESKYLVREAAKRLRQTDVQTSGSGPARSGALP